MDVLVATPWSLAIGRIAISNRLCRSQETPDAGVRYSSVRFLELLALREINPDDTHPGRLENYY